MRPNPIVGLAAGVRRRTLAPVLYGKTGANGTDATAGGGGTRASALRLTELARMG